MNHETLIIIKMISILINKLYIVNKYKIFYLKNVISKFLIKSSNFFEITTIIIIVTIMKTKRRRRYSMIIILILI